jgi:biopolymer transport protein ExbD
MNLKGRNKVRTDFSMASMTDIVFLLLIFFMLTSTLVTSSALDLVLPKSKAQSVKKQDVSVSIDAELNFELNGAEVSEDELEPRLLALVGGNPDAVILLQADESVPTGVTVKVMDLAYRNKLKMVLATDPRD